jgi:hypothetical protein
MEGFSSISSRDFHHGDYLAPKGDYLALITARRAVD